MAAPYPLLVGARDLETGSTAPLVRSRWNEGKTVRCSHLHCKDCSPDSFVTWLCPVLCVLGGDPTTLWAPTRPLANMLNIGLSTEMRSLTDLKFCEPECPVHIQTQSRLKAGGDFAGQGGRDSSLRGAAEKEIWGDWSSIKSLCERPGCWDAHVEVCHRAIDTWHLTEHQFSKLLSQEGAAETRHPNSWGPIPHSEIRWFTMKPTAV
jgi:hypothetical protein